MKIENTKWGSKIIFENGKYLSIAWKFFLLVFAAIYFLR